MLQLLKQFALRALGRRSTGITTSADKVMIGLNEFLVTGSGATGTEIFVLSGESTIVMNSLVRGFGIPAEIAWACSMRGWR
jgi:hypothetical protein